MIFFDTFAGAAEFITFIRPRLDDGRATAIGPDGPVDWHPWTPSCGPRDRLVIVGTEVYVERWPANAVLDDAKPILVPLHGVRSLRDSESQYFIGEIPLWLHHSTS